ncbi:MAG: helix-turn-helix domain-containing protein [Smithellaceae bacterium]|nr:helix-turn-helix domain-containing protein [Smithellaceae bacterium]
MGIKYSLIVDKLKKAFNAKNDAALARCLMITPQALSGFKKNGEFPTDLVVKYAHRYKLSLDDLLFDGTYRSEEEEATESSVICDQKSVYKPPGADALFNSDQKINIEEAMGKTYKVLNAGTALSVALYMNIQQFAAALDTGQALKICQDQMKAMQEQIDTLNAKVDRLSAPSTTERQGDGSEKKAM